MLNARPKRDSLPTQLGFQGLVAKANTGDQQALALLRKTLDENPQIWRAVGNLALHARMALARALAGGDQFALDSILRHAFEMETELLGPAPTPLQRLCVQRIVACWLETNYAAVVQGPQPVGETLKHARFALQVRESAEKRFNAAIKSYSLVRQMLPSRAAGDAQARRDVAAAAEPGSSPNGNGEQVAKTRPESAKGKLATAPANRLGHLLKPSAQRPNGHTNRLHIFAEHAVSEESHETQPI